MMGSVAVTKDNVQHGFLQAGIVDQQMRQYPDLNSMLSTCRKDPTQKDYEVCVSSFPTILKHCIKHQCYSSLLHLLSMRSSHQLRLMSEYGNTK